MTPIEGLSFVTMPELSLAERCVLRGIRAAGAESTSSSGSTPWRPARRYRRERREVCSLSAAAGRRSRARRAAWSCSCTWSEGDPGERNGETDAREMVSGSSAIFNACDTSCCNSRGARKTGSPVARRRHGSGRTVDPFLVRVDDTADSASVVIASDLDEETDDTESGARSFRDATARIVRLLALEKDLRSANEVHRRVRGKKKTNLEALKEGSKSARAITRVEGVYRLSSEGRTMKRFRNRFANQSTEPVRGWRLIEANQPTAEPTSLEWTDRERLLGSGRSVRTGRNPEDALAIVSSALTRRLPTMGMVRHRERRKAWHAQCAPQARTPQSSKRRGSSLILDASEGIGPSAASKNVRTRFPPAKAWK